MRRLSLIMLPALAVAACGGSSRTASTSPHGSGGAAVAPGAATTTTTTTATTAETTAATSATAGTSGTTCRAADLALSFLGQNGATGHGLIGFALKNTSSASCSTYGYPGILFLDRAGGALPTIPIRTVHDIAGTTSLQRLTVAPGSTVSFRLGVTHGINSNAGCTTAYGLQVIPPNDTATLRVTIGDGGAYECRTATVSPLQPGTSAYQQ